MQIIDYPYKPRPRTTLLGILFFGGAAAVMANAAIGNDRGLIINGIIKLETHGATIFYWCVAGTSGAFVLVGLAMLLVGLTSTARLRLTPTELSAPSRGFGRTSTTIPVADIQGIHVHAVHNQHFLDVTHRNGSLTILRSCLPSTAAFDEVCEALGRMVGGRALTTTATANSQ
jgi:hypothetical protein